MNDWGMWGAQTSANMLTSIGSNFLNYHLNKKLQKYTWKLNEMSADAADARRRALYNDFESPNATIRQLKEAGLSPSLYANGALGSSIGSTAGAQGGVSGGSVSGSMMTPADIAGIKVAEAQARKLNAEADEMEGKNEMGQAKIKDLLANVGLKEAQTCYTEAETSLSELQVYITDQNKEFSIAKAKHEASIAEHNASKAFWDAENSQLQWTFSVETFDEEKEKLSAEIAEIAARTAYEKSGARLNDAEKNAIQSYADAAIENAKAHTQSAASYGEYVGLLKEQMPKELELRKEELNVEKWRIGVNAVVDVLQGGMHMLGMQMFGGRSEASEKLVEHFDKQRNLTGGTKTQYRKSSGRRK